MSTPTDDVISVVSDVKIGPAPAHSVNEGDATRTAAIIANFAQTGASIGNYTVSHVSS